VTDRLQDASEYYFVIINIKNKTTMLTTMFKPKSALTSAILGVGEGGKIVFIIFHILFK